jgi:hypothetical protein
MSYITFHSLCPETAIEETRVITIFESDNDLSLPVGEYVFVELFCDECDCRRVFWKVLLDQKNVATIAYGWGKLSFYKRNFRGFDERTIKNLKGPVLESFQFQSDIAGSVFLMFKKLVFADKEYLARVERHYRQFKTRLKAVNG